MTSREFQDRLLKRVRHASVAISPETAAGLEIYFRLLEKWNQKINLTGFSLAEFSPETIDRLLVEPLVAARHVDPSATRLLDIGSGGGSPAIPMALAIPKIQLGMVESKTRKSVFLREAARAVGLEHAMIEASRYEELLTRPDMHEAYDLVTMRAVRVETRLLSNIQAFVRPGGSVYLFRGSTSADSLGIIPLPLSWSATFSLLEPLRSRLVVLQKRPIGRQRST